MRKYFYLIFLIKKKFKVFIINFFLILNREHAKELGNEVPKENPLIFDKPISTIITQGSQIEVFF